MVQSKPDTINTQLIIPILTEVYNPKTFIPHAALLRQAFAHCAKFPTAASRRSLDRVSVPVWPFTLSSRLSIAALVGHYPTNKLIERGLICWRQPKSPLICQINQQILRGISPGFPELSPSCRQITHALLTRAPL